MPQPATNDTMTRLRTATDSSAQANAGFPNAIAAANPSKPKGMAKLSTLERCPSGREKRVLFIHRT